MDFNNILELMKSTTFWFTTIFMGLVVSLVGNFLSSQLQNLWGKFSKRQAQKNAAKQKAFDDLVQDIHRKGVHLSDMEIHSMYITLLNLLYLVALLIIILLLNVISNSTLVGQIMVIILWLVLIIIANRSINIASYDHKLIEAVRKLNSRESKDQVDNE